MQRQKARTRGSPTAQKGDWGAWWAERLQEVKGKKKWHPGREVSTPETETKNSGQGGWRERKETWQTLSGKYESGKSGLEGLRTVINDRWLWFPHSITIVDY